MIYIVAAVAIVIAGITVPRVLIDDEKEQLISNHGIEEKGNLSLYMNSNDIVSRVYKLESMVNECVSGDCSYFMDVRQPLDIEMTREDIVNRGVDCLKNLMANIYDYNLQLSESDIEFIYEVINKNPSMLYDICTVAFLASPENSVLSLWKVNFGFPMVVHDVVMLLDAVTGLPLYIEGEMSGGTGQELAWVIWELISQMMGTMIGEEVSLLYCDYAMPESDVGKYNQSIDVVESDIPTCFIGTVEKLNFELQVSSVGYERIRFTLFLYTD